MRTGFCRDRAGGVVGWVLVIASIAFGVYLMFGVMGVHRIRGKIDEALGKKPVTQTRGDEGVLGMHQERMRRQDEARDVALNAMTEAQVQADARQKQMRREMLAAENGGVDMPPLPAAAPVVVPAMPTDPAQALAMAAETQALADSKRQAVEAQVRALESEGVFTPPPLPALPPESRPEAELTAEEKKVKAQMEAKLKSAAPTHRITFDKSKTMTGWILKETPDVVTFSESYGGAGALTLKIQKSRIQNLEALSNAVSTVTYRDVRFKMELPAFNLVKRPPYTVMTEGSVLDADRIVKILIPLHAEFMSQFRGIVTPEYQRKQALQVLMFKERAAYDRYKQEHGSWNRPTQDAFYSEKDERLVLLDPVVSAQDERYARDLSPESAIRHEGGVQLCFALGILPRGFTARWILEGLGMFCESGSLKQREASRAAALKQRYASDGYAASVPLSKMYLDDETAGAVVHLLMTSSTKESFLGYLRTLTNAPLKDASDARTQLPRASGLAADKLDGVWKEYLQALQR